ncbi:PSD1 and planctomycete cytochrome C domain-containing protein [Paludisphaera mucosa]|uniref:PSD1 and planctomycete cytochrome C domain-containing protein n=1 Tax=Paludisphaera mucosa TaxID=3030827 RepID=A0ABT6FEQ0_9BACT|nr:PSD1 and planctomycete cytochrome C domain-containing protein [Paludisphaera mucosa]MDG3006050.1 PSD1 and planctomycete cytochrome C domain-containing protein [Paludisphaera mucosa]
MRIKFATAAMLLGASAATAGDAPASSKAEAVLANACVRCHGADSKKGGLDLSRRDATLKGGETGPAVEPGKPDESLLIEKVAGGEMPPKTPLKPDEVEALRAWVAAGATYGREPITPPRAGADWWSLRPITSPTPPPLDAGAAGQVRTPVDAFILAKLEEAGLTPAPEADRAALMRRVSLDLVGLPPTPEEVAAFVADADPLAYEKLVDRLLASPHYGERWGRHWLDVVRFGESEGYETNMPRANAWPYRDYVIRSFNRDTPFPRFVAEQLAADALPPSEGDDWLVQAATGFLVGGTHDIVGNATIEGMKQQRVDDLDDVITATGTAFLGLTVNCARCHDHKFDPILQKDYYGMQAVFAGVNHASRQVEAADVANRRARAALVREEVAKIDLELDQLEPLARLDADAPTRPMVDPRRNVERFAPVKARMVRMTILATGDPNQPCLDELEVYSAGPSPRNVALATAGGTASASSEYPGAAIHKIAHLNDGLHGNGRSWISQSPGRGVATVAWPEAVAIDRVVWGRDREGAYKDRLPIHYLIEAAEAPDSWRVVASSIDRAAFQPGAAEPPAPALPAEAAARRDALVKRRAELAAELAGLGDKISVYAGMFSQPGPTHLLRRGDPMQPTAEVPPSAIAAVKPGWAWDASPGAPEAERRLALARWIGDPANPLPARVMVNRLWHYHFGRGLVATPSDFGFNGAAPSHPELLDWLAARYIAEGWRLKPIHRLMVLSAAYRRSSRIDPKAREVDAQNRLLWRVTPRRLEAEAVRDAVLAASGQLDLIMGGPGYNIWEKNSNYVAIYRPRAELGPDAFRRMIYQFKPRSQQDPTFGSFDCPDAALVAPRRNTSTTALQALDLLNSRFVVQQSEAFARRIAAEAGPDPEKQVERGFALALARPPSAAERAAGSALIRSHGGPAFCRALYNANEFVYAP